jgi:hypothetical protein
MGLPIEIDRSSSLNRENTFVITDIKQGRSAYLDNRVSPDCWIDIETSWSTTELEIALAKVSKEILSRLTEIA